ncbi:S-layer homology domain-containing protein, partial [Collinsella ihumii]
DTGIETLAASWATGAKVTSATDGLGNQLSGDLSQVTFTKGSGKYLVPTQIKGTFTTIDVDPDNITYEWADGTSVSNPENISDHLGVFYAVVTQDGATKKFAFKIVDESKVEGVQVKGSLVYNGQVQSPKFVDGEGEDFDTTGATISYTNSIGHTATPKDAGNYVALITMADGTEYNVPFSIAKLNLSEASLFVEDTTSAITNTTDLMSALKINTKAATDVASDLVVTKVSGPNGEPNLGTTKGPWTVTVSAKSTSKNVTGSGEVSFTLLDTDVADAAKYGRNTYGATDTLNIWLEDGEAFDASKVSVVDTDASGDVVNTYSGDQIEITYYDTINNKVVDASALANKGDYELTIRVKPQKGFTTDAWTGGTVTLKVNVEPTKIDQDKTLGFFFDGELAGNSTAVTYDGTDQLERLSVVVKDAAGNDLAEGTDYSVVVENGEGKEVDSIVDADTYTVTVKPLTFEFDGTGSDTFTITVNPIKFGELVPVVSDMKLDALDNGDIMVPGNEFYLAYTGATIETPALKYGVYDSAADKWTYTDLSSDLYNIVSIKMGAKSVKEIKDKGTYTVKIALTDAAAGNYNANGNVTVTVIVREFGHFADVDSTKWYSVPVEQAYSLYYVNGISGTNLFAPEADITRADAVCILFNMADGNNAMGDFEYSEDKGWITGFSDVDGNAYYAKALAWAKAFGVANGYGDGTFKPYEDITREEFASMLANYAKAMGKFEAANEGALDGMSDADTVSDWATDNIAWAVENGVMGNGGFVAGQSNITRAEVAAMAVNYQPENLTGVTR